MSLKTTIVPHAETITQTRIRAGLTMTDVARMGNIPHASVIRAEQGGGVRPKTAVAISQALGMDFDDLFTIESAAHDNTAAS